MKRVQVHFSASAWADLQRLAADRGKTVSQVLRDAIAFSKLLQDRRDGGERVLLERDGDVREVVIL